MSIKGVHHVSLKAQGAEEFQRVLDFYQQVLDCSLRLTGVLPQRRVAVAVEVTEGDTIRGTRMFALPPQPGPDAGDLTLRGIRFYLPGEEAARTLTVRADAHYLERGECCLL